MPDLEFFYTPITLRFQSKATIRTVGSCSGIYLQLDDKTWIISLICEKLELSTIEAFYTCNELMNDEKVKWIRIPRKDIKFEPVECSELKNFLNSWSGYNNGDKLNNKNSLGNIFYTVLPKYCTLLRGLKVVSLVTGKDKSVPLRVTTESCPFSLTNVQLFNGFKNIGWLNYKSCNEKFWLSDLKYLENMNGGVVCCGDTNSECLGLIWGHVVRKGHGELMIILGWDSIKHVIGFEQKLVEGCISDNKSDTNKVGQSNFGSDGLDNVVGINVLSPDGMHYWGSGVIVETGLIVTNRHVIMGDLQNRNTDKNTKAPGKIEILYDGVEKIVIENPELCKDIFIPFHDDLFDVCFVRCNGLQKEGAKVFGNRLLRNYEDTDMVTGRKSCNSNPNLGDLTFSIGYGLFFNRDILRPLKNVGNISNIVKMDNIFENYGEVTCMMMSSSSCWSGSSGGAVLNKNKELIGIMVSNGKLSCGEVLNFLNLLIPIQILYLSYQDCFMENKIKLKPGAVRRISASFGLCEVIGEDMLYLEGARL